MLQVFDDSGHITLLGENSRVDNFQPSFPCLEYFSIRKLRLDRQKDRTVYIIIV